MIAAIFTIACLPLVVLSAAAFDGCLREKSVFRDSKFIGLCEVGSAWFLGLVFIGGGLSKLMPFPGVMGPVWLEEVLAEHGLGFYARFIAWSEAIIGLLLLSKHTRVLGAIMMVPMLLNIFMVVVSLQWRGTPWVVMFFLCHNAFLLAFHFNRWRPIIDSIGWMGSRFISRQNLTKASVFGFLCIAAIGSAPFLNFFNWWVAMFVAAAGFLGLLWVETTTRFSTAGNKQAHL